MKKSILILLLLPFLSIGQSTAQSNTFQWGEGLTFYTGTFDTTQYSYTDIETIYNYLHTAHYTIHDLGNIWKIEQMDTANVATTDAIYQNAIRVLNRMKRPHSSFWDSLVVHRKREWREVYEVKRVYIQAMTNSIFLLEHYRDECATTADVLNGSDAEILAAWHELVEIGKTKNCCPDNVERKYQDQLHSPDRMKYARLELLTYGWWNCMNQFIYSHEDENIELEFQKLFFHIEIEEEDHSDHDH